MRGFNLLVARLIIRGVVEDVGGVQRRGGGGAGGAGGGGQPDAVAQDAGVSELVSRFLGGAGRRCRAGRVAARGSWALLRSDRG